LSSLNKKMSYSLMSEIHNEFNIEPKIKKIIIDLMLDLKKKEYENDLNQIKNDLKTMKKPTMFKEVQMYDFINNMLTKKSEIHSLKSNEYQMYESVNKMLSKTNTEIKPIEPKENFEYYWKNIKEEYNKKDIDSINALGFEYETSPPLIGKIYKKIYLSKNKNIRYCMPSCLIGFYNFSNEPLTIQWSFFTTNVEPKSFSSALDNNIPFFLSSCQFADIMIKDTTHDNFYILYCWLPEEKEGKLFENYHYTNQDKVFMTSNGCIGVIEKDNIDCQYIPYTLL